jgi:two-component system, NarL family, response regulator NreC
MQIRAMLVDDHQMFREGLRAILERDGKVTIAGEASNGREAVKMAVELVPDLVIMDIGMSELNGVDAARQIVAGNPGIRVIALSAHSDSRFVSAMLDAGASGYVLKEAAGAEILRAVHAVHKGSKFLSPEIAESVIEGFVSGRPVTGASEPLPQLAAREREVVQLLAEGKTSKDIARLLHISVQTVETHRRNIMSKLKLHSLASLTKYAIREGLTSAEN